MVPVEQRLLATSGMLIARVSAGERERAEDLGGYLIGNAPELEAHSSAFDRSLFWSALSEVAITQGVAREAAALAYRAQQAAVVSGDAAADAASALANAIAEFGRYPDDPQFASTATVVAGMSAVARDDAAGAIAAAQPAIGGMADERVLPRVRGFALGIVADAHLLRGEPLRTLTLLEGVDSNREHTLCFDMQRASAHLALGKPLKALQTTRACVAMGARQSATGRGAAGTHATRTGSGVAAAGRCFGRGTGSAVLRVSQHGKDAPSPSVRQARGVIPRPGGCNARARRLLRANCTGTGAGAAPPVPQTPSS